MNAPAGSQVCFRVRVSPNTATSPGWHETASRCFDILALPTWNYVPQMPTGSPADSATGPKPGSSLSITGRVDNTGNGTGPNYRHQIQVQRDGGSWSNLYNAVVPGMTAGQAPTARTVPYTIPANASHNEQFCFRTVANNGSQGFGVQGRVRPPSTFVNTIANGPRISDPLCYSVYNLRFALAATAPSDAFAGAGESINIAAGQFNVCNSAPLPAGASRGLAENIQITTDTSAFSGGSNNTVTRDIPTGVNNTTVVNGSPCDFGPAYNLTVPATAVVGNRICATISAVPSAGFSDRTGLNNTPVTDEFCVTVSNGPYLKVYGNDVWAGFEFSNGTSCSPGRGLVESIGRAAAGASGEYAAFAMGNIDSFGTANSPLSHMMKFANTPTHGSYGANRCVNDYYSLLAGQSATNPQPLNGLINGNNPDDGQYLYSSSQSTNGTNNYRKRQTILIDGNLTINGNIQYTGNYSRSDIPILVFVVRGNIFIDPNVTQLDGIYIAVPNGNNSGIIDTCAVDNVVNDYDPLGAPANGSGTCDDLLEINGSFIAQNIYFRRTSGGINEAATGNNVNQRCRHSVLEGGGNDERCAAETFRFSPEAYLARPFFDFGQPESYLQILQLRDLPPVF
jgi:hypothetical protein